MVRRRNRHLQQRLFGGPPAPPMEQVKGWMVDVEEKSAQRRMRRVSGERPLEEFGAEVPPASEKLELYKMRKRVQQAKLGLQRELTQLTVEGKAERQLLHEGARYEVYEIIGSHGRGIAKKRKIPTEFKGDWELQQISPERYYDKLIDVKSRRMADGRYRGGVGKAREALRYHRRAEAALRGRVPDLYGVQMRVDRPGFFVLQERIPILLEKPRFSIEKTKTPKGRTVVVHSMVGDTSPSPQFMEMVLPDIIQQLVMASKSRYPIDAHLGNWVLAVPRNKTIEEVVKDYRETGNRNFAVVYCDTLHRLPPRWASIRNTLPSFLQYLKMIYPERYSRFKEIALEVVSHDMSPQRATAMKKRIQLYEKGRKPGKKGETEQMRMRDLAKKLERARRSHQPGN